MTVPIEQVVVDGERRPINKAKLAELKKSISTVGLLNPITGVVRKGENGKEYVRLVAGGHRLQAEIELGSATIQCRVLEYDEALRVELAEIDENFIRNDPSAAEHALLTGRRAEIIRELAVQDGTLSQNATASRQGQRRAGEESGPEPASVRDQAKKTGETKDRIQRSKKRFETLGSAILRRTLGTSLDKGVQLDALAKLPEQERESLLKRAAHGAPVSAIQELREVKRAAHEEPQHQSSAIDIDDAINELYDWIEKYSDLLKVKGFLEQIDEYYRALFKASEETDAPERTSERSKKSKWLPWRKGDKGD
jgi:hypothetical protein